MFSRSSQYRQYTVTIAKNSDGSLHANKDPDDGYFEIDYGYGTDFTFVNNTGVAIDVQFQEPANRSMCHLQFSPWGSVFCESQIIQLDPGQSKPLHADALDLSPTDYCWSFDRCPGEVRAGLRGQVLVPIDPDLQIERDYLAPVIAAAIASLLSFLFAFVQRRRRPAVSVAPGSPGDA